MPFLTRRHRGRLQRLVVRARGVIVVFTCIITPLAASAQIVPDVIKRWSEEECIWLHRQALDECRAGANNHCAHELLDAFSMSTNRGLSALDAFWTARNRQDFDAICLRVCKEDAKPTYSQFKKEFCSKVRRR
jgi:hypothetical protein